MLALSARRETIVNWYIGLSLPLGQGVLLRSELYGTRKASGHDHTRRLCKVTGGPRVECSQKHCTVQVMLQPPCSTMMSHDGRFPKIHDMVGVDANDAPRALQNLHKSSRPSTCANRIMLEWNVRQCMLGKTPDNEMQLDMSLNRRSSSCTVSRVC